MIITDYPHNGRTDRIRHYSDAGMMIRQNETGNEYAEAVDVYPCKYTYTETDEPIPVEEYLEQEDINNGNS